MPSYTGTFANLIASGPIVETRIIVSTPVEEVLRANNDPLPEPVAVTALIDTGATGTVIQTGIAGRLGLHPVGVTYITTPSSTNVECFRYQVRLLLPNNVVVETIAIEAPLQGQNIQCLIGRDILAHGVLIYIGYINQFTLSF